MARSGQSHRSWGDKTLVPQALHVGVKLILFRETRQWSAFLGLGITSLIYVVCYAGIAKLAEPTHSKTGELEDGGADLNMGGLCTYYHDLIYLSAFVQIAAIFTDRAWLSYGVVPAYAAYQLWGSVIKPYFLSAGNPKERATAETAAERKKREKLERKQERKQSRTVYR